MLKNTRRLFLLVLISLLLAACGSGTAVPEDKLEDSASLEEPVSPSPSAPPATPTVSGLSLSPQPYSSPSGAFSIHFPQNWNCSESGQSRVDCQSADQTAAISLKFVATGYELAQPFFINLAEAEIVHAYGDKRAYTESDRQSGEGFLAVTSTWRDGEVFWQSRDEFTRAGPVIFQLGFWAQETVWPVYADLFLQVAQTAVFTPGAVDEPPAYMSVQEYSAADRLFLLDMPTSWNRYVDAARIPQALIEGFLAPDLHGSVQVVVYRRGAVIEQEFKATKTLEILRTLYGTGFRVSHDKGLPDGRERLAWAVEARGITGISFFDSWGSSLYIFTVLWDDQYQDVYEPVLNRVVESFRYE